MPAGYELLHELGRGATAVVWLAREQKLDRLVALKLMPAHGDRRLTQRLIREGQAAARLHHPHIVTIHALAANDAFAYLAMDFITGGDLNQRLARGRPVPRDAADMVRKLAGALSHAHANGVLHRDIKPSNVLLSATGEPHLADFGLAAPLEGAGDLTLPGQVAGTAAYLAPELLAGAGHASPRSDVYSLGTVLYECLAGRPPFIGDSTTVIFAQLARDEPAAPRLFQPSIPRDLETICLKCLEKTPALRYASAEALQDDLARFLRGEPIAARPAGRLEKIFRWGQRNPASATFASLAASLLLCLAIGGPLIALRLARAKARAATEAAASKAVTEFLRNDLLAQASPDHQPDRDLRLRTVLDRAAAHIAGRFPQQPLVEADIRATLASTYASLGEYEPARQQWSRVRELRQQWLGPDHPQTLTAAAAEFDALVMLGKFREAEPLALEVIAAQRRVLGPAHPDTLQSLSNLGALYRRQSRLAAAEKIYADVLAGQRRAGGPENDKTLSAMNNLGLVYRDQGRYVEAERLLRETLETRLRTSGPDNRTVLGSMYNLSLACMDLGNMAEAEKLCARALAGRKRVLGSDHPDTLHAMRILAAIEQKSGRLAEAEASYHQVIELQNRKLGPEHPDTLVTVFALAQVYRDEGRLAAAEKLHAELLEIRRRVLGRDNFYTLESMQQVALDQRDADRLASADSLAAETLAGCERVLGASHPLTVQVKALRGSILLREERPSEAAPLLRQALAQFPNATHDTTGTAVVQGQLGQALLKLDRFDEAEPLLLASYSTLANTAPHVTPAVQREIATISAQLTALYSAWNRPERARAWQTRVADAGTRR